MSRGVSEVKATGESAEPHVTNATVKKCAIAICDYLNRESIAPCLLQEELLTDDELYHFSSVQKSPAESALYLIKVLKTKPDGANLFFQCLKMETKHSGHAHIATTLRETAIQEASCKESTHTRELNKGPNLVKEDELKAMMLKKSFEDIPEAETNQIQSQTQILLVTANVKEYNAVLALLQPLPGFQALFKYVHIYKIGPLDRNAAYIFGKFGAFNAAVQMMVDQGPSSAQDVVTIAAHCFGHSLNAIFAVGVACGVKNKTNYLDVLVSKSVSFYNAARYGTTENGGLIITPRATANMQTSSFFLQYFNQPPDWLTKNTETVKRLTTKPKVLKGYILSGEYLIDNENFKEQLLEKFAPEAIGIEMEGAGLYHDYRSHNYEILVVKAVCDFGDGEKNKEYQPTAALLAAECLHHYLDNPVMPSALRRKKASNVVSPENIAIGKDVAVHHNIPDDVGDDETVSKKRKVATADIDAGSDADDKPERDGVNRPQPNDATHNGTVSPTAGVDDNLFQWLSSCGAAQDDVLNRMRVEEVTLTDLREHFTRDDLNLLGIKVGPQTRIWSAITKHRDSSSR